MTLYDDMKNGKSGAFLEYTKRNELAQRVQAGHVTFEELAREAIKTGSVPSELEECLGELNELSPVKIGIFGAIVGLFTGRIAGRFLDYVPNRPEETIYDPQLVLGRRAFLKFSMAAGTIGAGAMGATAGLLGNSGEKDGYVQKAIELDSLVKG